MMKKKKRAVSMAGYTDTLGGMARDFTKVGSVPKSEVRRRIGKYAKRVSDERGWFDREALLKDVEKEGRGPEFVRGLHDLLLNDTVGPCRVFCPGCISCRLWVAWITLADFYSIK